MASHFKTLALSVSHFNRTRYQSPFLYLSISKFPFSSLNQQLLENQIKNEPSIDENSVLNQLSDLLPICPRTPIMRKFEESSHVKQVELRAADGFLLPKDKLKGVFLQKLKGTTAIEQALTNVGVDLTLDVVAEVVNKGDLGGESMVMFFKWASKQPLILNDIDFYHVFVKALGRRKFFKFMMEILQDMRVQGVRPNLLVLSTVMDSYIKAGRVSKAIEAFGNLEEFGWKCDAESFNVLLRCLCQRSHVGTANSFFNVTKGKVPFNGMTYNVIIGGWSKYGCVSEMERNLKQMVEDGLTPDCSTFSYLIEGLGRAGRIEDAIEIFDQMEDKGCKPNTGSYNAIISNFVSLKDLDGCIRYYKSMLSNNCQPNIDTYTSMIVAFLKARKVADALEMFDEMITRGIVPATGSITSFIKSLCSYGPPHAALMIYKKANKAGCTISLTAYKLLLMRLSRFGKCGMILNLWDEMQECGYSSDMEIYEYVINGLINIGDLENAVLVMEESLREGFCPSRLIYSKLNNKLLASNKVERAYRLFLKIKSARLRETAQKFWRTNGWHF